MPTQALKEFRQKYIDCKELFFEESSLICLEHKVPDKLIHQWSKDTFFLLYDNVPVEFAELYLQTMFDFITMRLPIIYEVEDFKGAFEALYRCYFACLEFQNMDYLSKSPVWAKLDKFTLENINIIFSNLSKEDQLHILSDYASAANDIIGSGLYKKINPEPYFHFLTLPWSESVKEHIPHTLDLCMCYCRNDKDYDFLHSMLSKYFSEYLDQ